MKKLISFTGLVIIITVQCICQHNSGTTTSQQEKLNTLKNEVTRELTGNILKYWSQKMPDNVNGGFYGRIDGTGKIYPDAEKGGILNARILWTFSSAFRILKDTAYLRMAERAKDYILTRFIDHEFGGAYMSLKADGTPLNDRKHIYTNAFFIYALSEYYRATGDKAALDEAKKIFYLFERNASDKENYGYFEVFSRDWKRLRERLTGETSEADEKTMNTSLHVMEAYANLYRVSGDNTVGERLRNMVEIFLDKIIDKERFHLICFMDRNWNSTSTIDSYGHDIEASWLLCEAAGLLNDEALLKRVQMTGIRVAVAASEGLQPDGSMLTERNYATGHVRTQRSWWEQAETVVGYLNAFELTGDESYLDKSIACWDYIKKNFIDYKNGSWHSFVSEKGMPGGDKAGFWICPYHNGRMCMEVIERVK